MSSIDIQETLSSHSSASPSSHDVRLAAMRKVTTFAEEEVPALLKTPALVSPFIFTSFAILAATAFLHQTMGIAAMGSMLLAALISFAMGYMRLWNNHKIKDATAERISGAIEQLEHVLQFMQEYTRFVDRRTSSYFHCVTHTKISSYFALTEIRDNLTRRIRKLKELLAANTRSDLVDAFTSLQGTLVINNKVMTQGGTMRIIPLARVNLVVRQLVESIEEGLDILEAEIEIGREDEEDTLVSNN